jgi:hypothetical protein
MTEVMINLIKNANHDMRTYKCANGTLLLERVLLDPQFYLNLLKNEDCPIQLKHRVARCLVYGGYKVTKMFVGGGNGAYVSLEDAENIIGA